MKIFKYKHSITVYILSVVIMLATALGCFFGIKSAILESVAFKKIAYILLTVIGLFLFVLSFSLIACSRYKVKNNCLFIRMGLLCEKIELSNVLALIHAIDQKKLAISLSGERYIFVVIKPDDIEGFVHAIKKENPNVIYDVCYADVENKKND